MTRKPGPDSAVEICEFRLARVSANAELSRELAAILTDREGRTAEIRLHVDARGIRIDLGDDTHARAVNQIKQVFDGFCATRVERY